MSFSELEGLSDEEVIDRIIASFVFHGKFLFYNQSFLRENVLQWQVQSAMISSGDVLGDDINASCILAEDLNMSGILGDDEQSEFGFEAPRSLSVQITEMILPE